MGKQKSLRHVHHSSHKKKDKKVDKASKPSRSSCHEGYLKNIEVVVQAELESIATAKKIDRKMRKELERYPLLAKAVFLGCERVVDSILEAGENVNAQVQDGSTPLILAVENGYPDIVQKLLKKGADPKLLRQDGRNALMIAVSKNDNRSFTLLWNYWDKSNFCELNHTDSQGYTVLTIAVELGHSQFTKFLLSLSGIKVDKQTKEGKTPLMFAVTGGQANIVQRLLFCGADFTLEDKDGATAICLAISQNKTDARDLLFECLDNKSRDMYVKKRTELLIRPRVNENQSTISFYKEILFRVLLEIRRSFEDGVSLLEKYRVFASLLRCLDTHQQDTEFLRIGFHLTACLIHENTQNGRYIAEVLAEQYINVKFGDFTLKVMQNYRLKSMTDLRGVAFLSIHAGSQCRSGKIWLKTNYPQIFPFVKEFKMIFPAMNFWAEGEGIAAKIIFEHFLETLDHVEKSMKVIESPDVEHPLEENASNDSVVSKSEVSMVSNASDSQQWCLVSNSKPASAKNVNKISPAFNAKKEAKKKTKIKLQTKLQRKIAEKKLSQRPNLKYIPGQTGSFPALSSEINISVTGYADALKKNLKNEPVKKNGTSKPKNLMVKDSKQFLPKHEVELETISPKRLISLNNNGTEFPEVVTSKDAQTETVDAIDRDVQTPKEDEKAEMWGTYDMWNSYPNSGNSTSIMSFLINYLQSNGGKNEPTDQKSSNNTESFETEVKSEDCAPKESSEVQQNIQKLFAKLGVKLPPDTPKSKTESKRDDECENQPYLKSSGYDDCKTVEYTIPKHIENNQKPVKKNSESAENTGKVILENTEMKIIKKDKSNTTGHKSREKKRIISKNRKSEENKITVVQKRETSTAKDLRNNGQELKNNGHLRNNGQDIGNNGEDLRNKEQDIKNKEQDLRNNRQDLSGTSTVKDLRNNGQERNNGHLRINEQDPTNSGQDLKNKGQDLRNNRQDLSGTTVKDLRNNGQDLRNNGKNFRKNGQDLRNDEQDLSGTSTAKDLQNNGQELRNNGQEPRNYRQGLSQTSTVKDLRNKGKDLRNKRQDIRNNEENLRNNGHENKLHVKENNEEKSTVVENVESKWSVVSSRKNAKNKEISINQHRQSISATDIKKHNSNVRQKKSVVTTEKEDSFDLNEDHKVDNVVNSISSCETKHRSSPNKKNVPQPCNAANCSKNAKIDQNIPIKRKYAEASLYEFSSGYNEEEIKVYVKKVTKADGISSKPFKWLTTLDCLKSYFSDELNEANKIKLEDDELEQDMSHEKCCFIYDNMHSKLKEKSSINITNAECLPLDKLRLDSFLLKKIRPKEENSMLLAINNPNKASTQQCNLFYIVNSDEIDLCKQKRTSKYRLLRFHLPTKVIDVFYGIKLNNIHKLTFIFERLLFNKILTQLQLFFLISIIHQRLYKPSFIYSLASTYPKEQNFSKKPLEYRKKSSKILESYNVISKIKSEFKRFMSALFFHSTNKPRNQSRPMIMDHKKKGKCKLTAKENFENNTFVNKNLYGFKPQFINCESRSRWCKILNGIESCVPLGSFLFNISDVKNLFSKSKLHELVCSSGNIVFSSKEEHVLRRGVYGTYVGIMKNGNPVVVREFEMFANETVKLLATKRCLSHKNLATFYCVCHSSLDQRIFVVTELIEYSLPEYLKSKTTIFDGKHLVIDLINAVQYLHRKRIVHGFLKPSNIMVTIDHRLKVTGFYQLDAIPLVYGIMKNPNKATIGCALSNDCWRPYELIAASNEIEAQECLTKASDIQVAGMLIYYILSGGKHPFGSTDESCQNNILIGIPEFGPKPSDIESGDLIRDMIRKTPSSRLTIDMVAKHPYMWNVEKRFQFLVAVARKIDFYTQKPTRISEALQDSCIEARDWTCYIHPKLLKYISKEMNKTYHNDYASLLHFVTAITDHFEIMPSQMKSYIDQPSLFISKTFPTIFMSVYCVVRDNPCAQRQMALQPYF